MARKIALVFVMGAAVGLAARSMRADGPDVPLPVPASPAVPSPPPVPPLLKVESPPAPVLPTPLPTIVERRGFRFVTSTVVWRMRTDTGLDGKLAPDGTAFWLLAIRNNRILGGPDAPRETAYAGHHLSGEISGGSAPGDSPVVTLCQEGPNGYVCRHVGHAGDDGRVVGTWHDNRGMRGDFELAPERAR